MAQFASEFMSGTEAKIQKLMKADETAGTNVYFSWWSAVIVAVIETNLAVIIVGVSVLKYASLLHHFIIPSNKISN